jgi:hypothetical protein
MTDTYKDIATMAETIIGTTEANGWLPIESAPKDGTEILLLRRDVGRKLMCVGKWAANFHGSGWYRDKGWMMTGYQGLATLFHHRLNCGCPFLPPRSPSHDNRSL